MNVCHKEKNTDVSVSLNLVQTFLSAHLFEQDFTFWIHLCTRACYHVAHQQDESAASSAEKYLTDDIFSFCVGRKGKTVPSERVTAVISFLFSNELFSCVSFCAISECFVTASFSYYCSLKWLRHFHMQSGAFCPLNFPFVFTDCPWSNDIFIPRWSADALDFPPTVFTW